MNLLQWKEDGRIDLPNRIFGIKWIIEYSVFQYAGQEMGEVFFVSLDPPIDDGEFQILHDDRDGGFSLHVLGGRGPDVWDENLGHFDTLLGAMFGARKHLNKRYEDYEEMERIFERLALRGNEVPSAS